MHEYILLSPLRGISRQIQSQSTFTAVFDHHNGIKELH